ncbi:MAG: DnaJ domain-containing protein [Pseudomonadales bacterium]|jgi:hypothetical protein
MFYLALFFILASGLFALLRILLRDKPLTLQQFFILYLLTLAGGVLIVLGITGRLHWLFVLLGTLLPFLSGFTRWALRMWRAAGFLRSLKQLLGELTGLNNSSQQDSSDLNQPMSYEQALDILGLTGQPSAAEIKAAHRKMIQKLHPDRGGSTLLAKQVNEAKQVLLDHA